MSLAQETSAPQNLSAAQAAAVSFCAARSNLSTKSVASLTKDLENQFVSWGFDLRNACLELSRIAILLQSAINDPGRLDFGQLIIRTVGREEHCQYREVQRSQAQSQSLYNLLVPLINKMRDLHAGNSRQFYEELFQDQVTLGRLEEAVEINCLLMSSNFSRPLALLIF